MYILINECKHNFQSNDFYVYGYFNNDIPFYIGKGRDRRYSDHIIKRNSLLVSQNSNKHLYNAICKYINANALITIRLLFTGSQQQCFEKEIELIQQYGRVCNNSGILLNILNGGEGYTQDGKPVSQFNMFGEFIQEYQNAKEAARLNGWKHYGMICSCCKNYERSYKGFLWVYKGESPKLLTKNKPVYQFTKQNTLVNRFENASKAATFLNKNIRSEILKCCKGTAKTAGGFKWSYSDNPPF